MNQAGQDYCVLQAQNGQPRAFYLLFRHYQKPLLSFALKICDRQDIAADACQETWIKIARNIQQIKDPRAFKSWLYKTLKWKLLDLIKSESKHPTENHNQPNQVAPIETMHHENTHPTLQQAVDCLPSIEKQIIHLFYYESMSIKEIAHILKLATGTVKSRLFRAREQLKQKYLTLEKQP
ncbi:MAG: sigma-70 family RNA polymerase sigma factor [Enterobacterales bacterium]|nr:sigma-70 family RNA polymerase sigma factor [Enterobacterales bacterium]